MTTVRTTVQTCVIGAGLSGLRAAEVLTAAGRDVMVLEARDRVGGRLETVPMGSTHVDVGGQWIGPTQDRLEALARKLGVATFPHFEEGRKLLRFQGKTRTYRGLLPSVPLRALAETEWNLRKLDRWMRRVPLDAPWDAPDAAQLDARSVRSFLDDELTTEGARLLLTTASHAVFAAEPHAVSLLWFSSTSAPVVACGDSRRGGAARSTHALSAGRNSSPRGSPRASASGCVCRRPCAASTRKARVSRWWPTGSMWSATMS